jgi:hypothetical protein
MPLASDQMLVTAQKMGQEWLFAEDRIQQFDEVRADLQGAPRRFLVELPRRENRWYLSSFPLRYIVNAFFLMTIIGTHRVSKGSLK